MSNVFISVVSHGHFNEIKEIGCLAELSKLFNVILKTNSDEGIEEYCFDNGIVPIKKAQGIGFGANNNVVFEYCNDFLNMKDEDVFIILNPDVIITTDSVLDLISEMKNHGSKIATVNLFKDSDLKIYDNSIRRFPNLMTFIKSFILGKNDSIYDKSKITTPKFIDWSSGAFIAIKAIHYKKLNGFDENYFMYCEDIDLCYRSKQEGESVLYLPNISAIHFAAHNNRKLLSKHFYWHLKSVFRFLITSKIFK
ncbi:glycosyltransferase family 2 protein [Vibrio parahaemolyticus]|uniref:glycosyltransferase family 2 protein n=1 Tax=Vibrio parahaemolyticus TaxID=670 RepID=UPI00084A3ADE|nr:glycosyltransferase family 2 protein [Vibrio parahaemolyticus]EGQ8277090.1 glycosyltransferase family 2 protein [Vibrio parahaemolyticus]EGQ8939436.1 glycosyltransferase family 2 protein [Vibrio parahaemolyticus]EGQ8949040.1 glycosyltransferase family 2 protein [Vibrio parahaemolyticus]EGQ8954707.1 glycosyltransferase family 2 protein [Vibrio parahaemolyticus]EGQ8969623.1 glycosyltransferase family 2 protein [Vibrio parahaemolyticus]